MKDMSVPATQHLQPVAGSTAQPRSVLIFGAKPFISKLCYPVLTEVFPNCEFTFVHDMYVGMCEQKIPRGLRTADFPMIIALEWKPRDDSKMSLVRAARFDKSGEYIAIQSPDYERLLLDADDVVFAADPDPSSARNFASFLACFASDSERGRKHLAVELNAFDLASIKRAFSNPYVFEDDFKRRTEQGLVKAYFEANYAVNAYFSFGQIFTETGLTVNTARDIFAFSKYGLQLFLALSEKEPMTAGQIVHMMSSWTGTGKYPKDTANFGSLASRQAIYLNLVASGLIENFSCKGQELNRLSERGRRCLERLHPKCVDQDLPFRIAEWGREGMVSSKPKIDSYIKRFFGRQNDFSIRGSTVKQS